MCGRFISGADELSWEEYCEILRLPTLTPAPDARDAYPSQPISAIRMNPKQETRELVELTWGLIPSWAKDQKTARKLINVRGETVHQKFRVHFKSQRCIIPAAGFYEWKKSETGRFNKKKTAFKLSDQSCPILSFAGVWGHSVDTSGQELTTCAIVTTEANDIVRPIHDRMPVILTSKGIDLWLDPQSESASLRSILTPYEGASFVAESLDGEGEQGDDKGQLSLL